jgi:iron complex outermembrane receptor protein
MNPPFPLRHRCLVTSISTLSLAIGLSFPAFAQQRDEDEIVVTASRAQGEDMIQQRAASTTVVDTLAQDDTGDLPDQSMAEALRRIPGVSTIYDEDEGQFVSIRGIQPSLNYTTIDGLAMAAVGGNGGGQRRTDLALVPSQSARRIEVFKTFTADLDGGAVGGVLNIVPRSAYDTRKPQYGVLDVYGNYFTYGDVPGLNSLGDPKKSRIGGGFNATYARRFGAGEQFGIVLSGNFQQKQRDTIKPATSAWSFYTDDGKATTPDKPDWNGVAAPSQYTLHAYTNRIRNYGGSARLEWKPSDRWYNSLLAYYYAQGEEETRNSSSIDAVDQPQDLTPTGGSFRARSARVIYTEQLFDRTNKGIQFRSSYRPDPVSKLDFNIGYSKATFENHSPLINYQATINTRLLYDANSPTLFALADPTLFLDPAAYKLTDSQQSNKYASADEKEIRIDFSRNSEAGSRGLGFRAGADLRKYSIGRDFDYINYTSDKSSLAGVSVDPQYTPAGWPYPMVWLDNRAFQSQVVPNLVINEKSSARDSHNEDYQYDETTAAAYAAATYATDKLTAIGGLRYDHVDFTASSPLTTDGVAGAFDESDGGYDSWLPSLSVRYDFTPDFRLKAAYSKSIGRPDANFIAKAETRSNVDLTINRGNPDIRPRRADNYDLTLEKYFGRDSVLSIGLFDKEIKDEIFVLTTNQEIDGQIYAVKEPLNAEASHLRGIEFNYVNNSIPIGGPLGNRLGVFLNATRVWAQMNYRIEDKVTSLDWMPLQGNWSANAAIFYALPRGGELRLAANYQSEYVETVGSSPWLNEGWGDFLTMDLTLRYNLTDRFIVKAQARNLTNANRDGQLGADLEYRRTELEFGRSFYLNFVFKL